MNRGIFLVLLAAIAGVFVFAVDATGYHHPTLGRWLARDPDEQEGVMGSLGEATGFAASRGRARATVGAAALTALRKPGAPCALQYAEASGPYQYVGGRPLVAVDPLGLFSKYVCCSEEQIDTIKQDEQMALRQIAHLKGDIGGAIAADEGQYPWFTGRKLRRALSYLGAAVEAIRSKKVKCEPPGASVTCTRGAVAWQKWIFGRTVHLCSSYFDFGPKNRGAILVHEGTHFGGTLDVKYFEDEWPHDVLLTGWQDIASTYDTWIRCCFCVPGYDCMGRPSCVPDSH
jgi:hypothetical protein